MADIPTSKTFCVEIVFFKGLSVITITTQDIVCEQKTQKPIKNKF